MNQKLKRTILLSMMTAICVVVSYLESFIPVFIPGVKLGLANVIILIMLYEFFFYEALLVDILRIILVGLLRGTFLTPTFLMSLSGGMVSYAVMLLFTRVRVFSPIGVSVLGSIFHCVGQILVAIWIMGTAAVIYYLPFIVGLSLLTGVLSGIIALNYLKRSITGRYVSVKEYTKDE